MRRRKVRQFSLLALFVVLTLCATVCGLWSGLVDRPFQDEQAALSLLKDAVVDIEFASRDPYGLAPVCNEKYFNRVVRVDFKSRCPTDEQVRALKSLPFLQTVTFTDENLTAEQLLIVTEWNSSRRSSCATGLTHTVLRAVWTSLAS